MKKILSILLFLLSTYSCYAQNKVEQHIERSGDNMYILSHGARFVVDKKILRVKPLLSNQKTDMNLKIIHVSRSGCQYVDVPDEMPIERYFEKLRKSGLFELVEYVSANGILYLSPNDDEASYQNGYFSKIYANYAWDITTGNPNIKVAIIDTGFQRDHKDLGYGDDSYTNSSYTLGYDYYTNTSYQAPTDNHGTMIAGIIGAKTNNGFCVSGISGGNGCKGVTIISYRLGYDYGGNLVGCPHKISDAIMDAVDDGARVINICVGADENSDNNYAIEYAYNHGVTIVCAAGKDTDTQVPYPASHSKTIAVGAISQNTNIAFADLGAGLDLVAPGSLIRSTTMNNSNGDSSGTSFAAPFVSGTVALMLSVNSSLTPDQIRSILHKTAKKVSGYTYNSNGWNSEVGFGLLNTYAAVCAAKVNLTGPSIICNSGSFSISEIPTGASVSWSVSNNCLSIASGQGTSSVTLQKVSSGICDVSVNFSIGGQVLCTLTKEDVIVGTPDLGMSIQFKTATGVNGCWASNLVGNTFTLENDLSWAYDRVEAQLYRLDNNLNPSTLVNSWSNISTTNASIPGYSAGWYLFKLRGVNDCGYSNWLEQEVEMVDFSMLNFLLNYDSASEMLTLTLIEPDAENSTQQVLRGAYEIELWNGLTTTKVRSYRTDLAKYEMSLAGLPSGIYIVRVIIDGKTYSKKFAKK